MKPQIAEHSRSVEIQNKIAAIQIQKEILLWHKYQCRMLDKLDRCENQEYLRLCDIEETRRKLKLSKPEKLTTSPVAKNILPKLNQSENGAVGKSTNQNLLYGKTVKQSNEGQTLKEHRNRSLSLLPLIQKKKIGQSRDDGVIDTISKVNRDLGFESRVTLAKKYVCSLNDGDVKKKLSRVAQEEVQVQRAISPGKAKEITFDEPNKLTDKESVKAETEVPKTIVLVKSDTEAAPSNTSVNKTQKFNIFQKPIKPWKKTSQGKLVESEAEYKRRQFNVPFVVAKATEDQVTKLLEQEKELQKNLKMRYEALYHNIHDLEKYDPLHFVKAQREKKRLAELAESENKKLWKKIYSKLGKMGDWTRAVDALKNREALSLLGLDPNSPKALRKCKYLRLTNQQQSSPSPSQHSQRSSKNASDFNVELAVAKVKQKALLEDKKNAIKKTATVHDKQLSTGAIGSKLRVAQKSSRLIKRKTVTQQ